MENEEKSREIIITENFDNQGEEQYDHIYEDSPQNADKFADGISSILKEIAKHPKLYPPEPNLETKGN